MHSRSALNLREGSGKIRSAQLDNESGANAFRRLALPISFGLSHVLLALRCTAQGASDAIAFSDGIDAVCFRWLDRFPLARIFRQLAEAFST